jgi:hypothetical protein
MCITVTKGEYCLSDRQLIKNCLRPKSIGRWLVELEIIPNTHEFIQELDLKELNDHSDAQEERKW